MTVLPDAPIDPATGLPIPTIAVATDGGVSVIKDDGTVVDITGQSQGITRITFNSDNKIITTGDYVDAIEILDVPDVDTTNGSSESGSPNGYYLYNIVPPINGGATVDLVAVKNGFARSNTATSKGSRGLTLVDLKGYETQVSDMVASINSTHNTGWMNGDIKLATLSDTDDTDLVGTELVTNGTFDTDTSGWTSVNSTLSVVAGKLRVTTATGGDWGDARQNFSVVAGETYVITVGGIIENTGEAYWAVSGSGVSTGYFGNFTKTATFTPTSTGLCTITLRVSQTAGDNSDYDNISVRLAEPDRSVNGNGLQVFGTVQKNPVATGADLVAYSGFSSSNYLEQPYNSDLDFGTGDFCVMGWVNSVYNSNKHMFALSDRQGGNWGTNGYITIKFNLSNSKLEFITQGYNLITATPTDNTWQCICLLRKDGVLYAYLDGALIGSANNTSNLGATTTDSKLYLGTGVYGGDTLSNPSTKQALWRISATAPTAEQIERIYQDEKVLFQEGAQATLHGTSDAVTALAYDDTTELLHVGTSAGRSVFQGLKRVDNTTDAVGVAISASNGLVVEE
jgi:trimeric autotransporter adhesin